MYGNQGVPFGSLEGPTSFLFSVFIFIKNADIVLLKFIFLQSVSGMWLLATQEGHRQVPRLLNAVDVFRNWVLFIENC